MGIEMKTMAECLDAFDEEQSRRKEWRVEGGYLCHDSHYDIAVERINTPTKAWAWLTHMDEKSWFTGDCRRDFMGAVTALLLGDGHNVERLP